MCSKDNEGKSAAAERFITTLNKKIYKDMTSVSKNVYIDKLDDIVNKYNNVCHSTIEMKPFDVTSSTVIDSSKKSNDKDEKFKIGHIARISKYKNIFAKGYVPNWPEEVSLIKKVKNTVLWTYVISDKITNNISDCSTKKLLERFRKKSCKN